MHGLPWGGPETLTSVQRQAMAQLQAWAPVLQSNEGWAWVDMALVYDLEACQAYRKAPVRPKAIGVEGAEALAALRLQQAHSEHALDEAYRQLSDEEHPLLWDAQEERILALEHQCLRHAMLVEEMQAQQESCPPEVAPWVGALIAFDRSGWVLIKRHLVRVEDWPRLQAMLATTNMVRMGPDQEGCHPPASGNVLNGVASPKQ